MNVNEVIDKWEKYLNEKSLTKIKDLYLDDAVLWGTFSNTFRDNSGLIGEYFQSLFEKNELSVNFSSKYSRSYGDTTIVSGAYEFSYMEVKYVTHRARFTFVLVKDEEGHDKIAEHHSSLMP